ncbi:MAG TPA: YggS family pyridoxal phosphate-dependent enzyme [Firmicutes bacterium]|nr:YggS family pyridoxal phosphate-dependent enzyme [Bacillota bacterium]
MNIRDNIEAVRENILSAADRSGRDAAEIKLVAVSKTKPVELIREAVDAGIADLGENKVQELTAKYDEIKNVNWHLIGHLQKNKVKYIAGKTALIHSVDSFELAAEINKRSAAIENVQDVLIQVNVSGEESKFGIRPDELKELLARMSELEYVKVKGLMTISVNGYTPDENRRVFSELKELADENSLKELSMGMTHDYIEAIESGATIVRVGTGIFGKRDYSV